MCLVNLRGGSMADNMHIDILRRMVGQRIDEVAQSPLTSSRAVRMALTKAAYDTVGLAVTVKSVEEVMQPLDEMLTGLANDLMLVDLQRQGLSAGLIALDRA
jgi:flagellar motor switch protein FliM